MVVGIKVGGSSFQVAWVENGQVVVGRVGGQQVLPASGLLDSTGEAILSLQEGVDHPEPQEAVRDIPRLLCARSELLAGDAAERLLARFLSLLRESCPSTTDVASVITVPEWATNAQREAIVRAGNAAGFDSVQLVDRPVAAVLGAFFPHAPTSGHWLAYHLGSTSFYASIVAVDGRERHLVAKGSEPTVSLRALDEALAEYLAFCGIAERYRTQGFDARRPEYAEALRRVALEAEQARIQLSRSPAQHSVMIDVDPLIHTPDGRGIPLRYRLRRNEVEGKLNLLVERSLGTCRSLLQKVGLVPSAINGVVFSGGGGVWRPVQAKVAQRLGHEGLAADPLTVAVCGAAVLAHEWQLQLEALVPTQEPLGGARRPAAFLICSDFPQASLGDVTTIGRLWDRNIRLEDVHVSREHALISWDPQAAKYQIEDCASDSGTLVNGALLPPHEQRPLKDGDSIDIAGHVFQIRIIAGASYTR